MIDEFYQLFFAGLCNARENLFYYADGKIEITNISVAYFFYYIV